MAWYGLTQVDWDELTAKLAKLETECKASWDHLRAIVKHDMAASLKSKYETFDVNTNSQQKLISDWWLAEQ